MTETMKDQIRNWFAKDKEEQGKFPEYPSDEEGGSNLIFNPDAVIQDSDGETTRRDEKGKKDEKKEGEEEEEKGFRLGPSDFLTSLKEGDKTFSGETFGNKDVQGRGYALKYDYQCVCLFVCCVICMHCVSCPE